MRNFIRWYVVVLLPLLAFPAAAQQGAESPGAGKRSALMRSASKQQEKPPAGAEDPSYVIGSEDVIDVYVWKEPDFSRTLAVRPDGKISLPLINDIQAAGLTPTQLAVEITIALRSLVTQPQVTVMLKAINSRRVYVLGEVNKPGPVTLVTNMSVLQVLSSAGGLNQYANRKQIYVLRNAGGKQTRWPFNYKAAVRGDLRQNITLQPGDTIVVP